MKNKNISTKEDIENSLKLSLQYEKRGGLIPAIAQDYKTGQILMLGYVNREALKETLKTGYATFWSTSRNELWTKGKTSGDLLEMVNILVDCDQDAIVYQVEMVGKGACHTKDEKGTPRKSCFYRNVIHNRHENLTELNFLPKLK